MERFDEVVARYYQEILNYVAWQVDSLEDAKDLTQIIFTRAYRALGGFRGEASVRTWLFAIARNVIRDFFRRGNPTTSLEAYMETHGEPVLPHVELPARTVRLRRALATLPEEFREVVMMFYFEGLSLAEIAEALFLPVGTVKSRLNRARRKLRDLILEMEDGLP